MKTETSLIQSRKITTKKKIPVSQEDLSILNSLQSLKSEIDCLHNMIDHVTEPLLVESCIYELKATNLKYSFYLKLCKEKGLAAELL